MLVTTALAINPGLSMIRPISHCLMVASLSPLFSSLLPLFSSLCSFYFSLNYVVHFLLSEQVGRKFMSPTRSARVRPFPVEHAC